MSGQAALATRKPRCSVTNREPPDSEQFPAEFAWDLLRSTPTISVTRRRPGGQTGLVVFGGFVVQFAIRRRFAFCEDFTSRRRNSRRLPTEAWLRVDGIFLAGRSRGMDTAGQLAVATEDPRRSAGGALCASAAESVAEDMQSAPLWVAVSRGVALFLGTIAWLNLIAEWRTGPMTGQLWWIDLPTRGNPAVRPLLGLTAFLMLLFAVKPVLPTLYRRVAILLVLGLCGLALANSLHQLSPRLAMSGNMPSMLPFSLQMAACWALVLPGLFSVFDNVGPPVRHGLMAALSFSACCIAFPLAQTCAIPPETAGASPCTLLLLPCESRSEQLRQAAEMIERGNVTSVIVLEARPQDCTDRDACVQHFTQLGLASGKLAFHSEGVSAICQTLRSRAGSETPTVRLLGGAEDIALARLECQQQGCSVATHCVAEQQSKHDKMRSRVRHIAAMWRFFLGGNPRGETSQI